MGLQCAGPQIQWGGSDTRRRSGELLQRPEPSGKRLLPERRKGAGVRMRILKTCHLEARSQPSHVLHGRELAGQSPMKWWRGSAKSMALTCLVLKRQPAAWWHLKSPKSACPKVCCFARLLFQLSQSLIYRHAEMIHLLTGEGVGGFFRKQQAEAAASHWQLVQLAPTDRPGERKPPSYGMMYCQFHVTNPPSKRMKTTHSSLHKDGSFSFLINDHKAFHHLNRQRKPLFHVIQEPGSCPVTADVVQYIDASICYRSLQGVDLGWEQPVQHTPECASHFLCEQHSRPIRA